MNVYASVALSGDGYMDDRSPRRLILSTPADWREVMRLRAWADAILVGAETVRRDDPSLTVRDEALRRERLAANRPADPAKVTLSRSLRLAPASNFFTAGSGARIVFTDNAAASPLETAAEIVRIPDLSAARILTELEKRGFERLLVEGGPRTLGLFFAEGLVDTLRMAVNPAVRVGDPHAPRFEPPFDPARFPQQRRRLEGMEVTTYTLHPDRTEATVSRGIPMKHLPRTTPNRRRSSKRRPPEPICTARVSTPRWSRARRAAANRRVVRN